MAALSACDEIVLMTNGHDVAIVQHSSPSDVQYLDLPDTKHQPPHNQSARKASGKEVDEKGDEEAVDDRSGEDNFVLASAISKNGRYVALCDDKKYLHVYAVEKELCQRISSRLTPRRCTAVRFTEDNKQVVVADKSGDVYLFPLHRQVFLGSHTQNVNVEESQGQEVVHGQGQGQIQRDEEEGEKCEGGTLMLGHLSMLLDMLLIEKDKYIVTSDRDEKIRLSRYPDAYNIHAYCLGHTEFVVSLAYDEKTKTIMSGSGDATVRLWNLDGKQLCHRLVVNDVPSDGKESESRSETTSNNNRESMDQFGDGSDKVDSQTRAQRQHQAVQKICHCDSCGILFVSLYRSPHILLYRTTNTQTSGSFQLHLLSTLSGQGNVVSMSVCLCFLWVIREREDRLKVSAYSIVNEGESVELKEVVDETSPVFKILKTLNNQGGLMKAPPASRDLFPLLWKSQFNEDFKYQLNLKRDKEEKGRKDKGGKKIKTDEGDQQR